jgi:H+-transporting ATPase
MNKLIVQDEAITYEPNVTQMELLKQAALSCSNWKMPPRDTLEALVLHCPRWWPEYSNAVQQWVAQHPGANKAEKEDWTNSQIRSCVQRALADYEALAFVPFDPRAKRTEATIRVRSTGQIYKVTKGAPHIISALDNDKEKAHKVAAKVTALSEEGMHAVALAMSDPINDKWMAGANNNDITVTWHLIGLLPFYDPLRGDTKAAIARAESYGVSVKMMTDDHPLIAKNVARLVELGDKSRSDWPRILGPDTMPQLDNKGKLPADFIERYGESMESANGFAQVCPEHKYLIVQCYRLMGHSVGVMCDGAPALKKANVGFATVGATDSERAAASVVLTEEGLNSVVDCIAVSRTVSARMKSFLTYRIAISLQLVLFLFISAFAFHPDKYVLGNTLVPSEWPNVFIMPVLYLFLIIVVNDGVLGFAMRYDYTSPSLRPERGRVSLLFLVSASLCVIPCVASVLLAHFALDSWNPDGLFQTWGIGGIFYGQVVNALFLNLTISTALTMFSARTAGKFFFMRRPHPMLLLCAFLGLSFLTTLALMWPRGELERIHVFGLYDQKLALWVWIYSVIVFLVRPPVIGSRSSPFRFKTASR